MKKTKLIMPILGAATIGAVAPVATLTSCSNNANVVSLAEGSSASKEIGYKATYAYYNFKQENIKEPESTKVKLAKLVANGTEVTPVAGLVTSTADSAGNISVKFNLAIFKTQYNATEASFDLIFTNKKAGTSYTLTGFTASFLENVEITEEDYWKEYDARYQTYVKRVGTDTTKGDYNKVSLDLQNDWVEGAFTPVGGGTTITKIAKFADFKTLETTISYFYKEGAGLEAAMGTARLKSGTIMFDDVEYNIMATSSSVGGIPTSLMRQLMDGVMAFVKNETGGYTSQFYLEGENLGMKIYGKDNLLYFAGAVNQNCHVVYQNSPQKLISISGTHIYHGCFHFTYSKE